MVNLKASAVPLWAKDSLVGKGFGFATLVMPRPDTGFAPPVSDPVGTIVIVQYHKYIQLGCSKWQFMFGVTCLARMFFLDSDSAL